MRLRLLTLAAAALALAAPAVHAQTGSSVTLYGIADAGVEAARAGGGRSHRLISGGLNGSRLGFRGSEDLGGGLSAVFRLEQGLTLDDGLLGQGGRGWGREASVGLRSTAWGTLSWGRLPTPYFVAQSNVDAFAWMGSGGLTAITRSGTATRQLLPMVINARQDNAMGYTSPTWKGLEVRALLSAGEGSTVLGRGYGASVRYAQKGLNVLAATSTQKGGSGNSGEATALVLGGNASIGGVQVYVGYTNEKNTCTTCTGALARVAGVTATGASEFSLTNVGVRVPVGSFTAIAQMVRIDDRSVYAVNPGSRDANWLALGGEYTLSRRTVLYGSLGSVNNRNGSQYALGSGTVQQPAAFVVGANPRASALGGGIRHIF